MVFKALASILVFSGALCAQNVLWVYPPGTPNQITSINTGIFQCPAGWTVRVLPGTYTEQVDFQGKAVPVVSDTQFAAVIDLTLVQQTLTIPIPAVLFDKSEQQTSVLDGFTITGGASPQGGGIRCIGSSPKILRNRIRQNGMAHAQVWGPGGGIYSLNGAPYIQDNEIQSNVATEGGGIFGKDSSFTIVGNAISRNTADTDGGGVLCRGGRHLITGNTITANVAGKLSFSGNPTSGGGGIELDGTGSVIFDNNTVTLNRTSGSGGGLSSINTPPPAPPGAIKITNCSFIRNEALFFHGGGIHCYQSSPRIEANTLVGDFADTFGGAIHLFTSVSTVTGNVMTGNAAGFSGGGMALREGSGATVTGNTISDSLTNFRGGGIYVEDSSQSLRVNTLNANGLAGTILTSLGQTPISATDFGGGIAGCDVNSPLDTVIEMIWLTVTSNYAEQAGGGVWLYNCNAQLIDSTLNGNGTTNNVTIPVTSTGGGLSAASGVFVIERNRLLHNEADIAGAGATFELTQTGSTFINNIVAKNWLHYGEGAGVWVANVNLAFVNDTIAENMNFDTQPPTVFGAGSAVFVHLQSGISSLPGPSIVNCILRGDPLAPLATVVDATVTTPTVMTEAATVTFSNIGPQWAGKWNNPMQLTLINAPASFVDPVNDNYHINPGSPSRDKGFHLVPGLPTTDMDLQPRKQGVQVDQGADEVG